MFNIYLGIYIIVSIGIITMGTMKFYNQDQTLGAVIYCVGVVIICFVYGMRWFGPNALMSQAPVPWPPTINKCPDYLTYYARKTSDGVVKDTCIDLIGVAKSGLKKYVETVPGTPPASDDYYFSLATTSNDPVAKNSELCYRASQMGLTWEGITNGESCIIAGGLVNPSDPSAQKKCP